MCKTRPEELSPARPRGAERAGAAGRSPLPAGAAGTEPPGLGPCALPVTAHPPRPPPPPLTGRRPSAPRRSAPAAAAAQRHPALSPKLPGHRSGQTETRRAPGSVSSRTRRLDDFGRKGSDGPSTRLSAACCFLLFTRSPPSCLCCFGFDHLTTADQRKAAKALWNQLGVSKADFSSINSN